MFRSAACLATLVSFLSSPAHAGPEWSGNFETGNLSQWSGWQVKPGTTDRLNIISNPTRNSTYALRVLVRDGDEATNQNGAPAGGGWRAEVYKNTPQEIEGSEMEYSWSTLFPSNYPDPTVTSKQGIWQVFTQWHQCDEPDPCVGGSPPVGFVVWNDEIRLQIHGPQGGGPTHELPISPINRNTWHDFKMQVMWSHNPSRGYVKVWHNGELKADLHNIRTMFHRQSGNLGTVYLKMGLYRKAVTTNTDFVLYHDGMRQHPLSTDPQN